MSEYCLKQGSVLVATGSTTLRLFSMRFCPYAQRTRLVLHHKNIPHETINVNLKYKPDWFLAKNPAGLVPVIEYKGEVVCESSICGEYLEEEFPQPSLLPSIPSLRAKHRLLMYNFDRDITAIHGLHSRNEKKRVESEAKMTSLLQRCEKLLRENNSEYMTGNAVQLVDFHFWPFFERFQALGGLRGSPILPESIFPFLNKWVKVMEETPAVKMTRISDTLHQEFLVSLAQGDPQYDAGLCTAKL